MGRTQTRSVLKIRTIINCFFTQIQAPNEIFINKGKNNLFPASGMSIATCIYSCLCPDPPHPWAGGEKLRAGTHRHFLRGP
jgi:hypothetical protein